MVGVLFSYPENANSKSSSLPLAKHKLRRFPASAPGNASTKWRGGIWPMKFIQVQLHYSPLNFLFFDSVGSIPIHFHFKLKNAIKTLGIALNRTQRSNRPNGLWKWKFHVILLPHIYLPPSTGSLLKNSMAVVENWIQS